LGEHVTISNNQILRVLSGGSQSQQAESGPPTSAPAGSTRMSTPTGRPRQASTEVIVDTVDGSWSD
jgi:hypothetical protein